MPRPAPTIWRGPRTAGVARVSVTMGVVAPVVQRIAHGQAVWTIASDGSVDLRMTVERDTRMPFLPRFGLRMLLPRTMDRVSYCGLGPLESYVDKRRASWHGVFSGTPQTLFEPYIKPQENGNHHDCDWARVCGDDMTLGIYAAQPFDFQALPYTAEEMTAKAHNHELEPSGSTVVCVDYMQSGIGSNSCGPELQARVPAGRGTVHVQRAAAPRDRLTGRARPSAAARRAYPRRRPAAERLRLRPRT